jgi:hypothetical protein
MFLFEVDQEVTVNKKVYKIVARFNIKDQNWYTYYCVSNSSSEILSTEEHWFFKSEAEYEKARLLNRITELESKVIHLTNDVQFWKSLRDSSNRINTDYRSWRESSYGR